MTDKAKPSEPFNPNDATDKRMHRLLAAAMPARSEYVPPEGLPAMAIAVARSSLRESRRLSARRLQSVGAAYRILTLAAAILIIVVLYRGAILWIASDVPNAQTSAWMAESVPSISSLVTAATADDSASTATASNARSSAESSAVSLSTPTIAQWTMLLSAILVAGLVIKAIGVALPGDLQRQSIDAAWLS
ncbi:MAG: hypothetical protein HKL96_04975 [Phycisphaerales bacterium]|nr:hypothetical protein [Phycisphaerales bacterium]